uniref:Cysteine proteinase B (Trinotate prediction) n=1 Tax=Henneguya salminicola TaxID=69463 RepID=A0A6G3MGD2_HENSL
MMIRIAILAINICFIYSTSISKLNIPQLWEQYKLTYGLSFTLEEDIRRQKNFQTNYDFIKNHNSKNDKLRLEMNKFGHLEKGEIANCAHPKKTENPHQKHKPSASTIPVRDSINWVDYDMVTPVENQGGCGSCYSFSAVNII